MGTNAAAYRGWNFDLNTDALACWLEPLWSSPPCSLLGGPVPEQLFDEAPPIDHDAWSHVVDLSTLIEDAPDLPPGQNCNS